jgi:PAS domain S-box-containing protein
VPGDEARRDTSVDSETLPPALFDSIPVPVFVASVPSGRLLRWNRAAEEQCGAAMLASAALTDILHTAPADSSPPGRGASISAALSAGSTLTDFDATLRSVSGPLPVAASLRPLAGATEGPAAVALCYPTTRWADAARALRRNEERLAIALAAAHLGSWEFDVDTRVLTSSAQCKANHGFAADADMQLHPHIVDAIDPDHRDRFLAAIEHALQTRGSFEVEVPNRWPDGTDHWLLVAGRVVDGQRMVGVSQDITSRRSVEHALRASEEQYRAIVDAANEGIWRLDRHARITFANDRMAELLGVTAESMIGRHKWDFVFDEDVPVMQSLFERRKQGVSEEVADIRFRRGQTGEVWTLMAARPLYDESGTFMGAVDLFTDITERRRAEQELRDVDRRKDEFLAVLAHELRGPLAPIITAVKLLQAKGPRDPALQKLRETILRQTVQLSTLVDDLLDIGRITAGKLRLDKRRVDLRDVIRQAVEAATPLVDRRRHTLRVQLPAQPVCVDGDAARLVQVTANLLTNAAKYTPDGGRIEISLAEERGVGVVCVRDEGVGIPSDMLGRVFDRFVQVATAGQRSEGGLGIGLSVVKALVELHGGSVDAHSDGVGKGSAFTFRVPLAVAVQVS